MFFRGEVIVSLESVDLEAVVVVAEGEGVVGGPASKPWPPALMPSW